MSSAASACPRRRLRSPSSRAPTCSSGWPPTACWTTSAPQQCRGRLRSSWPVDPTQVLRNVWAAHWVRSSLANRRAPASSRRRTPAPRATSTCLSSSARPCPIQTSACASRKTWCTAHLSIPHITSHPHTHAHTLTHPQDPPPSPSPPHTQHTSTPSHRHPHPRTHPNLHSHSLALTPSGQTHFAHGPCLLRRLDSGRSRDHPPGHDFGTPFREPLCRSQLPDRLVARAVCRATSQDHLTKAGVVSTSHSLNSSPSPSLNPSLSPD